MKITFPTLGRKELIYLFRLLFVLISFSPITKTYGQDVEQVYENAKNTVDQAFEKPFVISGGLSAGLNFNYVSGIDNRSDPFSYQLNANLNINLFQKVNIPLSFNFADSQIAYNYQLPSYKFYGMSPSYKWATLHVGNRTMELSPYSFSGQSFNGVGVELKPGKYQISAFYGQLQRASSPELLGVQNLQPIYERKGWGTKVGYESNGKKYALIVFKATDDENSIENTSTLFETRPSENLVLSGIFQQNLSSKLSIAIDYGFSILTRDKTALELEQDGNLLHGLINNNGSTNHYNAVKTSLNYQLNKTNAFRLNYERIDPGYRTLGSLYFQNDLENYTISSSSSFFKNALSLSGNLGVQRNNLNGNALNTAIRFVGNINASMRFNKKLNVNLSYSNFSATSVVQIIDPDSPTNEFTAQSLAQINQNANLNLNYSLNEENTSSLMGMFSYQNASSLRDEQTVESQASNFYLANLGYTFREPEKNIQIQGSILGNLGYINFRQILNIAPAASFATSFFEKKLQFSTRTSYTFGFNNHVLDNAIFTFQIISGYVFLEKHSLNLNLRFIHRLTKQNPLLPKFYETGGNLNYSFSF